MDKRLRITVLTQDASNQMHKAILKSLKAINEYFEMPSAAKKNLAQDIKIANNVINAFAKIRQHESGREMVLLQLGKMVSEDKKEFKEFIQENLPHLAPIKKLKT